MRKIVIYYESKGGFGRATYEALAQGFQQCGEEVVLIDVGQADYLQTLSDVLASNEVFFSIGHNEIGVNISFNTGEGLYTNLNIPHVALLDDAPYNVVTFATKNVECNNLLVGVRDKSHLECLRMDTYRSPVKMSAFIPFSASEIPKEIHLDRPKDIDVIYSAIYYGMPQRGWRNLSTRIRNLLDDVADYLEAHAVTVLDGFKAVLKDRDLGEAAILKECYKYFTMMYVYIKTYRRVKCLEIIAASGIVVDVCDSSWENVSFAKNLRIHGTTYDESLELYKRSKILLQEMAEFNNGAHNRVFDATLSGTAVVSEYSAYLAKKFISGIDMQFFDWDNINEMPNMIKSILKNEQQRKAMVFSSYSKILKDHLPVNRAARILEMVELYTSGKC